MIVLDASVLVGYLDSSDAHHADAVRLLAGVASEELAVSVLTLAECLVAPSRAGRTGDVAAVLDVLAVRTVPLSSDAAGRLADLRVRTGLKMPDCCVVLAAEEAHADLATFDDRLARAAEGRGVAVHPR